MRRLGLFTFLVVAAGLLSLAAGCSTGYRQVVGVDPDSGGAAGGGGGGGKVDDELKSDGWGTLEGQITYDGDTLPSNAAINISKDPTVCACDEAKARGEDRDQIWIGKKTGQGVGVANAVIFLKPPSGKFFKIGDKQKDVAQDPKLGKVVVDQPFCAYEPRVVVLYPSYTVKAKKEGKDVNQQISTNQVFEVRNSAPKISHNTKIKGNPLKNSDKDSGNVNSGGKSDFSVNPQDAPLTIGCDIHPWMRGYAWAFNHPYAARTDADGKFKIEHVPAGAEVSVLVWHEGIPGGFLKAEGFDGRQGRKFTFKDGATETLNLKIK